MDHARTDDLRSRPAAVDRALALRSSALETRSTEPVSLNAIGGRTLAEAIVAERDLPTRSAATMDGFAVDADAEYPLRVHGEVTPESDPAPLAPGEAVRIVTGAPLPDGATAVLKREDATVKGDVLRGPPVDRGVNVYERGANVAAGERVFDAGERLAPRDAALLRDLGLREVTVHEAFATGVLATGTEIHEGVSPDRDSDMLAGLVRAWGHEVTLEGSVPDDSERVEAAIDDLAADYDVVVTSGGTGLGRKDYVVRALDALGEVRVHGVRIRCGKPVALAALPDHDAVAVAIPGKPVGAHTAALAVARPFFTGRRELPTVPATLAADVDVPDGDFEYWMPTTLADPETPCGSGSDDAAYEAVPLGHPDSPCGAGGRAFDPRIVSSATRTTRADGVLVTDRAQTAGERVRVVPYGVLY